jgi:hypothetical protein
MDAWRIGPLMWGALFVWIGLMMIVDEDPGIASIGAGLILLTGALIRRSVGRRAGFLLSVNGLLLLLLGINDLNGDDRGIPLFATTLIAIGALIITRAIGLSRRMKSGGFMITMERPGSPRDNDFD